MSRKTLLSLALLLAPGLLISIVMLRQPALPAPQAPPSTSTAPTLAPGPIIPTESIVPAAAMSDAILVGLPDAQMFGLNAPPDEMRIVEGRLEKYKDEVVLLRQPRQTSSPEAVV